MNFNEVICLYLREYLTDKQFEHYFYKNMKEAEIVVDENTYLNIISTNFNLKEECISLRFQLKQYAEKEVAEIYDKINDSYIELLVQSNDNNEIVNILKTRYMKKPLVKIACSTIKNNKEIISIIKQLLNFPKFCGNNWDAINDLIYDVILPERVIFTGWRSFEEHFPEDAVFIKKIFNKVDTNRCSISYE